MVKKPILFREQMALARPDVVERQMRNRRKSKIALQLRVLRDGKGMTQADVAKATGMAIRHIDDADLLLLDNCAFPFTDECLPLKRIEIGH